MDPMGYVTSQFSYVNSWCPHGFPRPILSHTVQLLISLSGSSSHGRPSPTLVEIASPARDVTLWTIKNLTMWNMALSDKRCNLSRVVESEFMTVIAIASPLDLKSRYLLRAQVSCLSSVWSKRSHRTQSFQGPNEQWAKSTTNWLLTFMGCTTYLLSRYWGYVMKPIDQAEWDRTAIPGTGVTSTVRSWGHFTSLTTVMQFVFSKKTILETSSKQLSCFTLLCFFNELDHTTEFKFLLWSNSNFWIIKLFDWVFVLVHRTQNWTTIMNQFFMFVFWFWIIKQS